jgi:hypothetical protein
LTRNLGKEIDMCTGGSLLADFVCGTKEKPPVLQLEDNLTTTADGCWVVWAFKLAHEVGDLFLPLSRRAPYPADATAMCEAGSWRRHSAPDPLCTCGFHALSEPDMPGFSTIDCVALTVVLSGRVLAFEWQAGGVLLRAQRQTVVKINAHPMGLKEVMAEMEATRYRPDDPDGRLARLQVGTPSGAGPLRLQLPSDPIQVAITDDAGWCQVRPARSHFGRTGALMSV